MGARNKPYSKPKDASYIRVSMKDDNLGLGAKSGVNVQATGLDAFQCLLGRLNGKKEDELEKEQISRDDLRRGVYSENRWGALRFISGGFLVGDRIKEVAGDEVVAKPAEEKCIAMLEESDPLSSEMKPINTSGGSALETKSVKKLRKMRKRKHSTTDGIPLEDLQHVACVDPLIIGDGKVKELPKVELEEGSESKVESNRRTEKAQRKLARQIRREKKSFERSRQAAEKRLPNSIIVEGQNTTEQVISVEPVKFKASSREPSSLRPNVRSRYVQQKKMALMDPQALNEVCKYP